MITLALILAAAAAAARDVLPSPGPFVPPLFYVHLPKTGSVLAATLLLFECPPDIFNYSIPYDALYEPDAFFAQPGNADCQPLFERMLSGHHGVPRALDPWGVVLMMRQPLARVVSGFFDGRHDCGYMRAERWHGPAADGNRTVLLAYAVCVRGLVAAMLGAGFDAGFRPVPRITAAVAARAAAVVDTAFFVGITEWYQCSVLVLHEQLFGDELLHDAQIARYRVGGSPAAAVEAAQTLKRAGFANPHDDALYLRAKARLWACDVPADS